jgi:hypothetical protein
LNCLIDSQKRQTFLDPYTGNLKQKYFTLFISFFLLIFYLAVINVFSKNDIAVGSRTRDLALRK